METTTLSDTVDMLVGKVEAMEAVIANLTSPAEQAEAALLNVPGRAEVSNLHNTLAMTTSMWQAKAEEEHRMSIERHELLTKQLNQYRDEEVEALQKLVNNVADSLQELKAASIAMNSRMGALEAAMAAAGGGAAAGFGGAGGNSSSRLRRSSSEQRAAAGEQQSNSSSSSQQQQQRPEA